jgi:hypothetical protein
MLTVAAILWLPVKFLWEHRKLAVFGAIAVFAFMAISTYNNSNIPEVMAGDIEAYQESVPSEVTHLPIYATPSRYYYVAAAYEDDKYAYLTDYYDFDNKWVRYNTEPLPLLKKDLQIYAK